MEVDTIIKVSSKNFTSNSQSVTKDRIQRIPTKRQERNNPIQKCAKNMNRQFIIEEIWPTKYTFISFNSG